MTEYDAPVSISIDNEISLTVRDTTNGVRVSDEILKRDYSSDSVGSSPLKCLISDERLGCEERNERGRMYEE